MSTDLDLVFLKSLGRAKAPLPVASYSSAVNLKIVAFNYLILLFCKM